ncbi:hypothetical protein AGABI1DRAFT_82163 [Agaricus bisporus var. burnettii JB137-S8]|uniref:Uncharacterized protein n=1 Tax=Agaricus bisporus var. burnettii (strain JB137-S8 / ATCC MYA-4627 / FGSC 10392) TaxID=597362 RepID=K5XGH8_AGABU|nr:uncharacterized protein AGABI1DRAFT_82163 [Agaricus bisporus var. burnettii JB137-S8]EKM82367.1 hypothetical protein AGABI1DRAFT_82163 [Agaricus bisporus var. burnettii JB137-S8]
MNLDEELSLVKTIRRMEQVKLDMEEERRALPSISGCQSSTSRDPPHHISRSPPLCFLDRLCQPYMDPPPRQTILSSPIQ